MGSQGKEDVGVMIAKALSNSFLISKLSVSVSPGVGRFRIKEWLKEKQAETLASAGAIEVLHLETFSHFA
jgi:hypothetical protein